MWGNNTSQTRSFDRLVGFFVTVGVVLSLGAAKTYVQNLYYSHKDEDRKMKSKKEKEKGDEMYSTRWRNTSGPQVIHNGSCHCQRVRFRIRSSRSVYAVDVPSKVRFPRLSVPTSAFEALSDESVLSLYAVTSGDSEGVGVHTFCSYCGVHVVYTPSTDPTEVQVNVDCLDKSNVDAVMVSYMATVESVPVPVTYEPARAFNRRGTGRAANNNNTGAANPIGGSSGSAGHSSGSGNIGAVLSNMYLLEGGSSYEDRYASPTKGGNRNMGGSRPYTPVSLSRPGGRGNSDPYGSDGGPVSVDHLSPFSKTRRMLEARSRQSEDACSSYLDSYAMSSGTAEMSSSPSANANSMGPYGGANSQGIYDNPLYRYSREDREAEAASTGAGVPQWNQYYTGSGVGSCYKESLDGNVEVDVAAMAGHGFGGGGFMSLSPSPMKVRSFLDTTTMSYSMSPAGLNKQLDSMKNYLSHYPAPGDGHVSTLPTM